MSDEIPPPVNISKKRPPVFGQALPPVGRRKPSVEGQRRLRLPRDIPAVQEEPAQMPAAQEEPIEMHKQKLILGPEEGINGTIEMEGVYYTIRKDRNPVPIWSSPPETRDAVPLARVKDVKIFVHKGSELSKDPLRAGWSEVVVLEIVPRGEKQKIRRFSDGRRDYTLCRAWLNDIKAPRPK